MQDPTHSIRSDYRERNLLKKEFAQPFSQWMGTPFSDGEI
jgi:hypothetical protein